MGDVLHELGQELELFACKVVLIVFGVAVDQVNVLLGNGSK